MEVGVKGSECSVFLPSRVSSFLLQKSWEVICFNLLLSTYLYWETSSQPELSRLLSGPVLVSGWTYVQPIGLAVWDKPHSNSVCSSTQDPVHHLNPPFFSYTDKLVLYHPTFFPSRISLSSHSFRQVLCKWTYDGTHQVVLDDNSNHYVSRIKHNNRKKGCYLYSI